MSHDMSTSVPTTKVMDMSISWHGGLLKIWGIRVSGRRTSRCKGPVAGTSLMAIGTERRPAGECDRGSIPVSGLGALFGWAGQPRSLLSLPWASSSSLALLDSESSGPILQSSSEKTTHVRRDTYQWLSKWFLQKWFTYSRIQDPDQKLWLTGRGAGRGASIHQFFLQLLECWPSGESRVLDSGKFRVINCDLITACLGAS